MDTGLSDNNFVRANGPNILMIMSDQHRADWMGCAGANWVKTPNLNHLAQTGMRFTNTACNAPVCAPSRAALASGLRCSSVNVLTNNDLYPLSVPTYYQVLRAAGYRTGCVGKTDLHKRDHWEGIHGNRPLMYHLGFADPMETEGKMSGASFAPQAVCPYTYYLVQKRLARTFHEDYSRRHPVWFSGDSVMPLNCYHDDFVGRNACRYLQDVSDEVPWHYFVSFVGPHNPWDAPEEYSQRYDSSDMPADCAIEDPMEGKPEKYRLKSEKHSRGLTEEGLAGAMLHYSGMITLIDDYVGKFKEVLKERGMLDNTVIIYCSDHGEMMGDHGLFAKSVYYEQAIRVPVIISGPSVITGESDALVQLYDLAPTILELAGVDSPFPMESSSLVPLLRGETDHHREYQISELRGSRMLYDGYYKFVEHDVDRNELYDLQEDPDEVENLTERKPKKAGQMQSYLRELLK